jgi:hypothetical protein
VAAQPTIVADPGLGSILRFDQAQVTTILAPVRVLRPTDGVIDFMLDRLPGVAVAFDPQPDGAAQLSRGLCGARRDHLPQPCDGNAVAGPCW